MDQEKTFRKELVGEDLSGVTFVRDYVQLQFNPPPLVNAYTPVTVHCGGRHATYGDEVFSNLLIAQINKFVRDVAIEPGKEVRIEFEDDSIVAMSLLSEHYQGPEAYNLFMKDGGIIAE